MLNEVQAIAQIQTTQKRFAVTIGITMGVIMSIYFFTFAMLIDKGKLGVLLFEAVSSLIFVVLFFLLNRISFALTRARFQNRQPHAELLTKMRPQDVNTPAGELLTTLRHMP